MSELPKGWADTTLGDVIELRYGKSLPEKDRIPGSFGVYGSNGVVGSHTASVTGAPAIVVGRKGSIGDVQFSDAACFPIDTTYFVDRCDCVVPRFAMHLLSHLPLREMNRASAIPGLNREDAYGLQVALPPLPEQRRIVAKIDSLTGKSKRARDHLDHIPRLVEKYKQAVLAAAFRGDLTREWRLAHGLPEPHSVQLGNVAEGFNYGSAAKSVKEGRVPVLRMGNIQNGKLDWADLVFTNDAVEISKYRLVPGDVLFNRTNSPALVGKTALYDSDRVAIYAGYLIKVRCKPELLPTFLTYCLNSPMGRAYSWAVKSDGVSQSNINAKKLAAFSFDLPSPQEQAEIVRRIETAFIWIDRLASEATSARRLIDRLDQTVLARAFRGELVPQDPTDEPASALLDRIRAERGAAPKAKRGRKT